MAGYVYKVITGTWGFRSNKGPLRTGPGNGQCVEPAQVSIKNKNMSRCEKCIQDNTKFWDDTLGWCGNAYGNDNGNEDDIVAFDYENGNESYSCDSPAIITDPNPPGGVC